MFVMCHVLVVLHILKHICILRTIAKRSYIWRGTLRNRVEYIFSVHYLLVLNYLLGMLLLLS